MDGDDRLRCCVEKSTEINGLSPHLVLVFIKDTHRGHLAGRWCPNIPTQHLVLVPVALRIHPYCESAVAGAVIPSVGEDCHLAWALDARCWAMLEVLADMKGIRAVICLALAVGISRGS
jgi:hypothetical protein